MNFLNKTCLASFSSSRLKRIKHLAGPEACISSGQMDIFKMMCQSVGIRLKPTKSQCAQIPLKQWGVPVLTKKFIEIAKMQNKFVHVWTIDDKNQMFELIEFGVDGLMTDKPSVLKEAMVEKGLF